MFHKKNRLIKYKNLIKTQPVKLQISQQNIKITVDKNQRFVLGRLVMGEYRLWYSGYRSEPVMERRLFEFSC